MASIKSIVTNRRGKANHWRVEQVDNTCELWHYSTRMLVWIDYAHSVEILDWSTGHGSVSDQNGVNTAFKVLGVNGYYSRKGGAEIEISPAFTGERFARY